MKRFNNLYASIFDFENLLTAFYKARKGKRKKPNVAAFEHNLENELLALHQELKDQSYHPGPYRTFQIYDPKKRMISAAPFRDRVVHHALCNIIEPIFDRTFIHDSYANRTGKGTHAGIQRCQQYCRIYPYVLKADIKKYFPSIDHLVLKQLIRRKIKCQPTLWLIDLIIDNSNPQEIVLDYFDTDDLFSPAKRKKGLPMGNLTSQFFANLYLSPMDHFVKEVLQVKGYARYVDDFVLFNEDKKRLHEIRGQLANYLAQELRIVLHPHKTVVFPVKNGVNFLGQRVFPSHRLLKKDNLRRFKKRTQKRIKDYHNQNLKAEKLEAQLNAWLGHAKQANTFRLQKRIFNQLVQRESLPIFLKPNGSWAILE